jgi:preprotein translocase subunit YajC
MGKVWILAATATKSSGNNTILLLGFVVLLGLLYFVMIRPQRNRQRQAMQMQREIVPGMRVRTTAGMYATVTSVEGQDVVLEIAPGVEVRYMRRAIMEVVSDGSGMGFDTPSEDISGPAEDAPETHNETEDDAATG